MIQIFGALLFVINAADGGRIPLARPENAVDLHGKAYWLDIKTTGAVPKGASVNALASELSMLLKSPDPAIRDDLAYELLSDWIYRQRIVPPEKLRELMEEWKTNLHQQIGEVGNDSVVGRSFSALALSVLVARDNESPFLTRPEFASLLEAALSYLKDEKDLRGYSPPLGWVHSCAHTADLLKFLARSRHLLPDEQENILNAIAQKLTAKVAHRFSFGEDERLARAALSVLRRNDLQPLALSHSLKEIVAVHNLFSQAKQMDLALFDADENSKAYLRSLYLFAVQSPVNKAVPQPIQKNLLETLNVLAPAY